MTIISNDMLADMHARRLSGESMAAIAARYNIKPMTAYQRLRRTMGATERTLPGPNNDNHPDRVTKMSAYNGGCSTLSGMVPVTLARVPTIDGPFVAANGNAATQVAA